MIDYCGTTGSEWVPELFVQSCQLHDICYSQQIQTRTECDTQFFDNMIAERGYLLIPIAFIYFSAVVIFGNKAWKSTKNKT